MILNGPHYTNSIAFSRDGRLMAVGGADSAMQGTILIYDTNTWIVKQELAAPGQNVLALVFTPENDHLISSGTDGRIRLWSLAEGSATSMMSPGIQANQLALSPDGSLLASSFCSKTAINGCSEGGAVVWRTTDWTILQRFDDLAEGLVFSPDGSLLITGSGVNDPLVRIRRTSDWGLIRTLPVLGTTVSISPDSRILITTDYELITRWEVKPLRNANLP